MHLLSGVFCSPSGNKKRCSILSWYPQFKCMGCRS